MEENLTYFNTSGNCHRRTWGMNDKIGHTTTTNYLLDINVFFIKYSRHLGGNLIS